MLRKWKRIIAAVISSAMILTCSGCTMGKNTAYALTVDGYQVKSGIYIYYLYTAFNEGKSEAKNQDENLDTEDEKALGKVVIDGKEFPDYVKSKATENCVNHVTVLKHFDDLKLSLSEEQEEEISDYVDASWEANEKNYLNNGIGKESLKEVITSSYKSNEIFKAYYGENGIEKVNDSQLQDYYAENNARVRYIDMDLHDSEGNDLDAAGKKEIKDMAEDFLKRAEKADNEEEMLEEFNTFQEEYDKYVSDKAAEASGEDDTATTEATTTAVTTTTTTTVTTADASENTAAETANDNEDAAQTTDESVETTTTTAPENDEESEETTTTTSIHAGENIIHVVTTDEGTKEEDVSYSPSKKSYDWIFKDAKFGVPEIIEDEDTIYVMVKFDIKDRMTDDDLWSESTIENVRYEMFSDKLQDKIDEIGDEYEVEKNEKSYKKYDPFDIKFE